MDSGWTKIPYGGLKVALITGASTGIGLATARQLLEDNYFVILTARSESLPRLATVDFLKKFSQHWVRPLDVRDVNERRNLVGEIEREFGRLDVLVNNAAVIYRSPVELAYDFESREQMLVNFHAPLELIKAVLPLMRMGGTGHIVNVSSAAGFLSVPTMGLYAASKHALEAASESLYHELKPWNIHVSLVEPGFIASDAYRKARLSLAMDRATHPCATEYTTQSNVISALIDRASALTDSNSDHVARSIRHLLRRRRPPLRLTVTLDARAISFLKKMLPESFFNEMIDRCLHFLRAQLQRTKVSPLLPANPQVR